VEKDVGSGELIDAKTADIPASRSEQQIITVKDNFNNKMAVYCLPFVSDVPVICFLFCLECFCAKLVFFISFQKDLSNLVKNIRMLLLQAACKGCVCIGLQQLLNDILKKKMLTCVLRK
jgi:hypothetical protein